LDIPDKLRTQEFGNWQKNANFIHGLCNFLAKRGKCTFWYHFKFFF
jgi:hypothetical protein